MYKRQFNTHYLFLLLSFVAPYLCSGQTIRKDTININQLINSLTECLNNHYVFPEKAKSISMYLQSQLNDNSYAAYVIKPQKLAEQIEIDISKIHHDPHMHIQYDPAFVPRENNKPSKDEINQSKNYWKENNYSFKKVEILPGNIGYFSFNVFVDDIESAKSTIYSALKFLANTNAIIIDLRENYGGSPHMVSQMESYFFKEKMHMNDLINRSSNDTTFFYADPAKADSLNLSMPVYILTSHSTFSGAEDFSYGLQKAKRATIVGEITGGGAHPQMPFSVGQVFVISIPYARSLNPVTKTDWEGTGVVSNVKIEASAALSKTQELIFNERLLVTKDEKETHKSEYYLRLLKLDKVPKPMTIKFFSQFVGTYPDVTLYLDNNKLICKNNDNKNVSELKHISNSLFVIDENAQIEFFKNDKGHYSSIKIYLNDGNIFEEVKQK